MVVSDFWKGIKQNYFVVFFSLLFYTVVMALSVISLNMSSLLMATGSGVRWLLVIAQVFTYVIMLVATLMVLYMISLGVTYKLSFGKLIRNSFILSVALVPTNIFFAVFAAMFFLLIYFGTFIPIILVIAIVLAIAWGLSVFMLVWTDYSQWVFDTYINDKVPGARKDRGIYRSNKSEGEKNPEDAIIERSKLTEKPVKPITDTEIEIYELPTSFTRADLEKLEETKRAMREDSDRYSEEHADDAAPTIDELMSGDDKKGGDGE